MSRVMCAFVLVGALSGCAALDSLLQVGDGEAPDALPTTVETVIERGEDVGNGVLPGLGWVLGGLATIGAVAYRALRKPKESE